LGEVKNTECGAPARSLFVQIQTRSNNN